MKTSATDDLLFFILHKRERERERAREREGKNREREWDKGRGKANEAAYSTEARCGESAKRRQMRCYV